MLKRNFILSILVLIITVTYLTYSKPAEVETANSNNDFVDLTVINNITTIPGNLPNESLIIVNLWASWCIPCIEEVDELKKISQDSKFYVIGLLVDDSMENGEEFINKYSIDYVNVLLEDDVEFILTKFKWTGIPTSLVLNLDYEIIKTFNGPITYQMINELSQ
uniref:Thiol-disulfide isomerase n=1 Tax=Candidatus Actinomarina minuta TaxID=1389454 RepID=S5DWZ6_9ACTN|nr:thiol-disulfide isomerase [Candidatus Actinomarina minuta]